MREIRQSGSEGGGGRQGLFLPLSALNWYAVVQRRLDLEKMAYDLIAVAEAGDVRRRNPVSF